MAHYETELRNKNRGYMKLIVRQKAIQLMEYLQFLYFALGPLAETLTRTIGLKQTQQITESRFAELNSLHYEVENRMLRLIDKLERKREDIDSIAPIAEDPEEYVTTLSLHHAITP